jgi:cyanophycinase-like exopeptidase
LVILLGSGERTPSGRRIFDWLFRRLPTPVRVAILETPAGFEPNSDHVARQIGDSLEHHLRNYDPQVTIVPARKRGTPFSPDDAGMAALLAGADAIFAGPGSPTYAVRQLQDSLTWHTLVACHRLGAAVVLASAAAIASGALALPVYEIYKVGEDLHWHEGLDFFGAFGLRLVVIPHWNNQDGGEALDTSHGYMGRDRFESLLELLPPGLTVVGIDEQTALVLDLAAGACHVLGKGGVTVSRQGNERRFGRETSFSAGELGSFHPPSPLSGGQAEVYEHVRAALTEAQADTRPVPPPEVIALLEQREYARGRGDWPAADDLRERIAALGWRVGDAVEGPQLEPSGRELS